MKPTKALRRLIKIEALMSDVVERFPTSAPTIRKALKDAMVAIAVAKEAVSLETTSGIAKNSPVELPTLKKAASKSAQEKKASKKTTADKAMKTSTVTVARKTALVKKLAVRAKAQKTLPASAQVQTAGQ